MTTLLRTVTFLACQKASLVSKVQPSKTESSMYWKEYLPLSFTFVNFRSCALSMKYSLSALQFSMVMPLTDQPNAGEIMSQSLTVTSAHSRSAFMPCRALPVITTSSLYQSAARHFSVSSQESSLSPRSCQNG